MKVLIVISGLLVLIFTGCAGKNMKNDNIKILKLASWGSSKHYVSINRAKWITNVNRATAGKIKIVEYSGGKLFGPKEMHSAVSKGSVDLGVTFLPNMIKMVPMLQGVFLPFYFDNINHAAEAYTGDSLKILDTALEKKGIKLIYVSFLDGVQMFSNNKTIAKVEDFKGLKILMRDSLLTDVCISLGAVANSSTPQTEQYMAMKKNDANVVISSTVGGYFQKYYEVAPYLNKMDVTFPAIFVCMNLTRWNELPKDVQEIMMELGREQSKVISENCKDWETTYTEYMSDQGGIPSRFSKSERYKIKKKSEKIWNKWALQTGGDSKKFLKLNSAYQSQSN